MEGAALVEPNIPVVQKCSRDFCDTAHLSPPGAAGCSAYLPISWAGFGETSWTRSALRAKEAFATLWFLQNKENILFFSALGQRQCPRTKSLLCFGPLGKACRDDCLWKALCWTRTSSAMASLKTRRAVTVDSSTRGCTDHQILPLFLSDSVRDPHPVPTYEHAHVYLLRSCALCYVSVGVQCNQDAGSLLGIWDQEAQDFSPQADAATASHATLIFLLPLCTRLGFSYHAALNGLFSHICCFICEMASWSVYL